MKSFSNSVSFLNLFSSLKNQEKEKKTLFWLATTVSLLAFLELGQDYIKSALSNSNFFIMQSLSYKLFWFVFIPFTFLFLYLQNRFILNVSKRNVLLRKVLLIIVITISHLLVFSILLYLISFAISEKPWSLISLLTQKLSTRLYLGLSFYLIFSFIFDHFQQRSIKSKDLISTIDTLPIKNGSKTILVGTQIINRIVSDGPYIEVYTMDNKYVILDSLKNIINRLPENFRRIHRSTIVNIDHIESSRSRGNGDYDLIIKGGITVRLSRNYAKPLKGILH